MSSGRPAHDLTVEQIHHGDHIQSALGGSFVGKRGMFVRAVAETGYTAHSLPWAAYQKLLLPRLLPQKIAPATLGGILGDS